MRDRTPGALACLVWALGLLAMLVPARDLRAARLGPPEGSHGWQQAQKLLERPGPSLAAADDAWKRGDRLRAEWLLSEVSLRYPIVGDHADWMRARVLLELAQPAEAAEVAGNALASHPDTPLRAELLAVQGEARARLQDEEGARELWRAALDETRDDDLRAKLLLETAASQERSGDQAGAIQTWRLLWVRYPLSGQAAAADARLDELEAGRKEPLRTAIDWSHRGDSLYRARRNAEALVAYDRALGLGLSPAQRNRARLRRAQTLFRMRSYSEAVEAFGALPQTDDVPIWYARSLARAGRVPEAIERFEKLGSQRRGANALRARFLAALLLEGRGEHERARTYLESLTQARGAAGVRQAALWRLGWSAFQEGRYADAIGSIEPLLAEQRGDPIGRLRARYWRARALEQLGADGSDPDATGPDRARSEYEAIAQEFPLTYYGWRARMRLPADVRQRMDAAPPPAELPEPGARRLSDDQIERIRILLEAGFDDDAIEELSRAARDAGGLTDRLELAKLFRSAGNFQRAQRLMIDPYPVILARGPSPTFEELWWHAFPAAFLDLVEQATAAPGSVDPALVFSIMREESGFRPEVVSPVGARGLLQIMEPTGARLARAVGRENFTADDLFLPQVNIRLGSHYLGELSRQFDGRLSAAIASYNAGPDVVSRWLRDRPDVDDDVWVEAIPYEQTRSYVKRVLRSLQAYRLLY